MSPPLPQGSQPSLRLDWGLLRRLLPYARRHARPLLASLVLLPTGSVLQLVQPWIVKHVIDGPIAERNPAGILPWGLALLAILLCLYGIQFVQAWLSQLAGQGIVHDLRVDAHRHLLSLRDSYFRRNPAGRLLTRVTGDVEGIGEMFASGFLTLVADVVLLVGICAALLWLDWRLACVAFLAMPPLFWVSSRFQARLRDAYREIRARVSTLNAYLQERIAGITVIQLFARENRTRQEFELKSRELIDINLQSIRLDAQLFAFVDATGHLVTALLVAWAAAPIVEDRLTFGALVAFIDYTARFFQPIRDLSEKLATMQAGLASAERVFQLLDEREQLPAAENPHIPTQVRGSLHFDGVWFGYTPERTVLRGFDLDIRPGERVALLGATGAGKSTALKLAVRQSDVATGAVSLDGVDVRQWSLPALRRAIGVVPQEVFLFMGTVRDNLTLSDPTIDESRVIAALERVGATPAVERLGGLDAELRERGSNLSAGERQLLAFARVLCIDPPVLVLDEATAHVDSFMEARIQRAMAETMAGRTTLVVAHRLSTIQQADRIAVLSDGRVAECGSPAELLALGGFYARLHAGYFGAGSAGRELHAEGMGVPDGGSAAAQA